MLFAIKAHIAAHPDITLTALAQHFDVSSSAMAAMVGLWIRKGVVSASSADDCGSGGCGSCPQRCTIVSYRCVDDASLS